MFANLPRANYTYLEPHKIWTGARRHNETHFRDNFQWFSTGDLNCNREHYLDSESARVLFSDFDIQKVVQLTETPFSIFKKMSVN